MRLALLAGKTTKIQGKRQLNISVHGMKVTQDVWLTDILEPFILVLNALGKFGVL